MKKLPTSVTTDIPFELLVVITALKSNLFIIFLDNFKTKLSSLLLVLIPKVFVAPFNSLRFGVIKVAPAYTEKSFFLDLLSIFFYNLLQS